MSQNIELSREGIKISYLRFLSDSAVGYIILLLLIVAYYNNWPIPFVGIKFNEIKLAQASPEVRVFLFLLLVLLATPLGLLLNGIGWIFVAPVKIYLLRVWISLPDLPIVSYLVFSIRAFVNAKAINNFFGLEGSCSFRAKELYGQARYYEEILTLYFPAYLDRLEASRGLKRFVRSLAVLALALCLYFWKYDTQIKGWVMPIVFVFLILFSSLLEYSQSMRILFNVYVLSSKLHDKKPSRSEVIENLRTLRTELRYT